MSQLPPFIECCQIVLIALVPPLGVIVCGLKNDIPLNRVCIDALINIVMLMFFYVPGMSCLMSEKYHVTLIFLNVFILSL